MLAFEQRRRRDINVPSSAEGDAQIDLAGTKLIALVAEGSMPLTTSFTEPSIGHQATKPEGAGSQPPAQKIQGSRAAGCRTVKVAHR